MSSEHDLLFSQSDSVMFSELANLPEFEDLGQELLSSDAMDAIAEGGLLEELDGKEDLKSLFIPGLHPFSTALAGAKAVEKPEFHALKAHNNVSKSFVNGSPQSQSMAFVSINSSPRIALAASDSLGDASVEFISADMISPRTAIATRKMNCMSLKDKEFVRLSSEDALSAPPLSSLSPLGQAAISSTPSARPAERMILLNPSTLHNISPISSPSPTISPADGSCTGEKGQILAILNGLPNRMLSQEEKFDIKFSHSSLGKLTDSSPVSDCSDMFGRQSPPGDASGNVRVHIPPHVLQDSSHLHSIQRSYSSHSLGQFRTSLAGASQEEFSPSITSGQEALIPGLSKLDPQEIVTPGLPYLGSFPHYQISDSPGLSARSPISSIRRVCSTGDLQFCYGGNNLIPLEHSNSEEIGSPKIGHYSAEERKMKLDRYRQKRYERNFNKKIKYACRKTLADSRPRIRGRFARTDDVGEPILEENGAHTRAEYGEVNGLLVLNDKYIISNNTGTSCWNIVQTKAAV